MNKPCDACNHEIRQTPFRAAFRFTIGATVNPEIFYLCGEHSEAFETNWYRFGGNHESIRRSDLKLNA